MSTTYTAWTVIGVHLQREKLIRYDQVKGCNCFDVDPRNKFCPHCAAPTTKSIARYIAPFNGECGYIRTTWDNGISLVYTHEESDDLFLGHASGIDHDIGGGFEWLQVRRLPDNEFITDIKDKLRKMLAPHGLWKGCEFGIYNFLGVR